MQIHFHISVNATRLTQETWGDTGYARMLARAITAQGHRSELFFRGEAPNLRGNGDVVLRIIGPHLEDVVPGVPNLLWAISPPNLASNAKLGRYQRVCVASRTVCQALRNLKIPCTHMDQASDTTHFHPKRRPEGAASYGVTFVGGYASRAPRAIIMAAIALGYGVNVWGPGWDGKIPDKLWHGARLDPDALAQVYAQSEIVLNSHMPHMARMGMMSNRSFDALASGAMVISDHVAGFDAKALPGLVQVTDTQTLGHALENAMGATPASMETRMARHAAIVAQHSFDNIAGRFIAMAQECLAQGQRAAHMPSGGHAPPQDPQRADIFATARDVLRIAAAIPNKAALPPSPKAKARIHPMMADLREITALAKARRSTPRVNAIAYRARRVLDLSDQTPAPLSLNIPQHLSDAYLIREMRDEPLFAHSREGFDQDRLKPHLVLWNRKQQVDLPRPVGVFLHLYYAELAGSFATWLARIPADYRLYVSTDTDAKAAQIAQALPQAQIRIMPNIGRDIYPKLYGFGDVYCDHDIVLHLHGKMSRHSGQLDQWLQHIVDCILPSDAQINRILSLFQSVPQIGLVAPVTFQPVISAAHWGTNYELAQEMAHRMGLSPDLPGNDKLRFAAGSMFWARADALRPLLDLNLSADHFAGEADQIDGTLAHAAERMIAITAMAQGYAFVPVAAAGSTLYKRYQHHFKTNGDLRQAIKDGLFRG